MTPRKETLAEGIDLWLGDCREILPTLGKVDAVVTDPPYRTISGGTNSTLAAGWRGSVLSKNDGKIFEHNSISPKDVMGLISESADRADIYVMTNNLNLLDFLIAAQDAGLKFHNFLQWQKDTATANRWYMNETEHVLYFGNYILDSLAIFD